jgi:hypothetical protein
MAVVSGAYLLVRETIRRKFIRGDDNCFKTGAIGTRYA